VNHPHDTTADPYSALRRACLERHPGVPPPVRRFTSRPRRVSSGRHKASATPPEVSGRIDGQSTRRFWPDVGEADLPGHHDSTFRASARALPGGAAESALRRLESLRPPFAPNLIEDVPVQGPGIRRQQT
jgi:hypothetical protein